MAGEGERIPLTPKATSSSSFDIESPPLTNGLGHVPAGRGLGGSPRRRGVEAGLPGQDKERLVAAGAVNSSEETAPLQTSASVKPNLHSAESRFVVIGNGRKEK